MAGVMDPPVLELDHASSMMSPPTASLGANSFAPAMEDAKGALSATRWLVHVHGHRHGLRNELPSSFRA